MGTSLAPNATRSLTAGSGYFDNLPVRAIRTLLTGAPQ
jgi:hypothetical protein